MLHQAVWSTGNILLALGGACAVANLISQLWSRNKPIVMDPYVAGFRKTFGLVFAVGGAALMVVWIVQLLKAPSSDVERRLYFLLWAVTSGATAGWMALFASRIRPGE